MRLVLTDTGAGAGAVQAKGLPINLFEISYFLSREIIVPTKRAGRVQWREAMFAIMSRKAGSVASRVILTGNSRSGGCSSRTPGG